jgi:hypothetical protein
MSLSARKPSRLAVRLGLSQLLCASLFAQASSGSAVRASQPAEAEPRTSLLLTNQAPDQPTSPITKLAEPPELPVLKSPVDFFRELLALERTERTRLLADRSLESRKRILAKVREYELLSADQRELRLRVTELRWYLLPLMNAPATNRAAQLALIPEKDQSLIKYRLREWDKLPASVQKDILEYQETMSYITNLEGTTEEQRRKALEAIAPAGRERLLQGLEKWGALPETERRRLLGYYIQFFGLRLQEREKQLNTLSEPERRQIEKTLRAYHDLSPNQRAQCERSFKKFAGMSFDERQQFLKNAERWQLMSPTQRQAWRDLVYQAPLLPPDYNFPPVPPLPQIPKRDAGITTNGN